MQWRFRKRVLALLQSSCSAGCVLPCSRQAAAGAGQAEAWREQVTCSHKALPHGPYQRGQHPEIHCCLYCLAYVTLRVDAGRLATAGLLATLSVLHPRWHFGFLALLMLDVFSHWFQMYATLVSGSATHKVRRPLRCLKPFTHLSAVKQRTSL